jgi:hypothetical protein
MTTNLTWSSVLPWQLGVHLDAHRSIRRADAETQSFALGLIYEPSVNPAERSLQIDLVVNADRRT